MERPFQNKIGGSNTGTGYQALYNNTSGAGNTATGVSSLYSNNTGGDNTCDGYQALYYNTIGAFNAATGFQALLHNNVGNNNTAVGYEALFNNATGSSNIALGAYAGNNLTTGNYDIDIGNQGVAGEGNTIRIGTQGTQTATYVAGINGTTVAGGIGVIIDSSGHLGTSTSAARYKENIHLMDNASETILALHPVTFRYKKELDPQGIPQFGLVAEQVDKIDPDLVVRDEQGKPYSVRYEAVNAMLLNEFLKEHRKVEKLEAKLAKQENDFAARLKEQDAKIQQVSDKMGFSRPLSRTVDNN